LHGIPLEGIKDIPENPPVYNVFACINADILKNRAVLIDTPGLEATEKVAALTYEALKNADAVILVVDDDVEAHDRQFLEILKKEGKGDRLFMVMNKTDGFSAGDRDALIEKRMAWLSDSVLKTVSSPLFASRCSEGGSVSILQLTMSSLSRAGRQPG